MIHRRGSLRLLRPNSVANMLNDRIEREATIFLQGRTKSGLLILLLISDTFVEKNIVGKEQTKRFGFRFVHDSIVTFAVTQNRTNTRSLLNEISQTDVYNSEQTI